MRWIIVSLSAIAAFLALHIYINARPLKCPSCKRMNLFRRKKTGRHSEGFDDEGALRNATTEYVCSCCRNRYWIVWDDFEGCRASVNLTGDGIFEPKVAPD